MISAHYARTARAKEDSKRMCHVVTHSFAVLRYDQIWSPVEEASTTRWIFNPLFTFLTRSRQFNLQTTIEAHLVSKPRGTNASWQQ